MRENWRMVVLDDDPTGIQTVNGCLLITTWDEPTILKALNDEQPFFYILINTRAHTREEAARITRSAVEAVVAANEKAGYKLMFVSRSDSCLRGHFPLETDVIRQVLGEHGIAVWPKTPFVPAFIEAGRLTIDGTHYMRDGQRLVPVGETEFARDNVFAYQSSVLTDYITEKGADPNDYTIVNAQDYSELYAFVDQLTEETKDFDGAVVVRSSSSFPKAMSGIADRELLTREELLGDHTATTPPCFVVGSHVGKTTRQLEALLNCEGTCAIEVDVQQIIDSPSLLMSTTMAQIEQVVELGLAPVVYTSRQELRLDDADSRQHLGQQVSKFLVDIVRLLPYTPSCLIAKGGITSHDILTKGLNVKSARVMGQIIRNVPCVMTQRFPYVIFPGNVGEDDSLKQLLLKLKGNCD